MSANVLTPSGWMQQCSLSASLVFENAGIAGLGAMYAGCPSTKGSKTSPSLNSDEPQQFWEQTCSATTQDTSTPVCYPRLPILPILVPVLVLFVRPMPGEVLTSMVHRHGDGDDAAADHYADGCRMVQMLIVIMMMIAANWLREEG